MSDTSPATAPQRVFPDLRAELDITPRWFEPNLAALPEDAAAIAASFGVYEGAARALFVDLSVGVSGVRLVLMVPPNNPTSAFEAERCALKAQLDGLDAAHPRRARVTAQRRAAEEQAHAAEAAKTAALAAAEAEAKRLAEAEAAKKAADAALAALTSPLPPATAPKPQKAPRKRSPKPSPDARAQARPRPRRRAR